MVARDAAARLPLSTAPRASATRDSSLALTLLSPRLWHCHWVTRPLPLGHAHCHWVTLTATGSRSLPLGHAHFHQVTLRLMVAACTPTRLSRPEGHRDDSSWPRVTVTVTGRVTVQPAPLQQHLGKVVVRFGP
jgi:hypothetical protein